MGICEESSIIFNPKLKKFEIIKRKKKKSSQGDGNEPKKKKENGKEIAIRKVFMLKILIEFTEKSIIAEWL